MRPDVETTILRSDEIGDVNATPPPNPSDNPRFVKTSGNAYDDTDRNPYFKYQPHDAAGQSRHDAVECVCGLGDGWVL